MPTDLATDHTRRPVLEMRGISKTFPGVRALRDVSLTLYPGEVHSLMGENGAGKSTLMKILSGAYTADEGKKVWSVALAPGFANPITYTVDGRQYITVATGRSGTQAPGRLYTFALDAAKPIPSMEPVLPPLDPSGIPSAELVRQEFERVGLPPEPGRDLIVRLCSGCHQPTVLTRFRKPEEGWRETMRSMVSRGMPGTPQEHELVLQYLARYLGPGGQ